ncbi:hypothetical protein FSP39_011244 [Pinctada imbricata]|uniref:Copper amine oxidase N2-terminal domain-containing protein n=1 Tax=Pinctada imbricata TaxID=66713 RepID=A0AA88YS57_PINIB|nr:hypothetical protein FSP39_011244 [Pinctada imbricata]
MRPDQFKIPRSDQEPREQAEYGLIDNMHYCRSSACGTSAAISAPGGMTVTPVSKTRHPTMHRDSTGSESEDESRSTDDIISLLDSLKIGSEKPAVKQEKDYSSDLISKGPKDSFMRRGPYPTSETPNRPISFIPSHRPNTTSLKYEPGLHDLQFPKWNYTQSDSFAPGQNDSCRYWTKAKQENRLPQLMKEQQRLFEYYRNQRNQQRNTSYTQGRQQKKSAFTQRQQDKGFDVIDGIDGRDDDLSQSDLETDFAGNDCHFISTHDPFLSVKDQFSPISKETWSPLSNLQLNEVEQAPESEQDLMLRDIEETIKAVKHSPPHLNTAYPDCSDNLNLFGDYNVETFPNSSTVCSSQKVREVEESRKSEPAEKCSRKRTESDWREECKPSPPKLAATDPMYDKDIDEDNLIIANASPEVIEDVLNCLKLEDNNVLERIINEQNQLLRTPLFLAVMDCKPVIVQTLLEYGANPNIQGKVLTIMDEYDLRSPLHLVAEMGDQGLQLLQILLGCERTNIDQTSESDLLTPLHIALKCHRVKINNNTQSCFKTVKMFLDKGADTDIVEETTSKTPVMLAIETRDIDLIKLFLDAEDSTKQAFIHDRLQAITRGGDTPLHIAAGVNMKRKEKMKLLRILVRSGADSNAENNCKELPEEIATRELIRKRSSTVSTAECTLTRRHKDKEEIPTVTTAEYTSQDDTKIKRRPQSVTTAEYTLTRRHKDKEEISNRGQECNVDSLLCPFDLSEPVDPPVFHDLTTKEIKAVQNYLYRQSHLRLVHPGIANSSTSFIFGMELHLPPKHEVLQFLYSKAPIFKPPRAAVVTLFRGDMFPRVVQEYIVFPLPWPSNLRLYRTIPYHLRPFSTIEFAQTTDFIAKEIDRVQYF